MELKVDTGILKSKAADAQSKTGELESCIDRISELIAHTSGYWIGDAGDLYRRIYQNELPQMEEALRRLQEHPKDLLVMAGVYEEAEKAAQEMVNPLPIDIIS